MEAIKVKKERRAKMLVFHNRSLMFPFHPGFPDKTFNVLRFGLLFNFGKVRHQEFRKPAHCY